MSNNKFIVLGVLIALLGVIVYVDPMSTILLLIGSFIFTFKAHEEYDDTVGENKITIITIIILIILFVLGRVIIKICGM